ncbi:fungal-specific transcription factor domain-containing protein [Myxozyma melibiosi]|uniref:Fungal-specific transcription factor domain-containing protein n=1 Tax=Myxozyma melibiosi TaxID=54550 RepID=A0ABR1EZN2_9ASCO
MDRHDRKRRMVSVEEPASDDPASRLSLSCNACKDRKVKCNRTHPVCGLCQRNGLECLYVEKRKPGLKPGFSKDLVERVDKLEEAFVSNLEILREVRKIESVVAESAANLRNLEAAIAPSFVQPEVLPTQHQQQQQQQKQNDLPPYDVLLRLVKLYIDNINSWFCIFDPHEILSRVFDSSGLLNSDDIIIPAIVAATLRFLPADEMCDADKDHFHTAASQKIMLQALEIPTLESLEAMVILAVDVVGTSNGPKCWPILAMICSIALKLGLNRDRPAPLSSGTLTPQNGAQEGINTAGVPIIPESADAIVEERRRRLFWGIYLLDRYSAIGSSFMFDIPSSEVQRRLPFLSYSPQQSSNLYSSEFPWLSNSHPPKSNASTSSTSANPSSTTDIPSPSSSSTPVYLEPFAYQLDLLGILSAIHEFLRRQVNINSKTDSERWQIQYRKFVLLLDEWRLRLPSEFATTEKVIERFRSDEEDKLDPIWIHLHSLYHTTVIRINSSAGYPYRQSANFQANSEARARSLASVSQIVSLAEYLSTKPSRFYKSIGPHYAFTLWVAARLSIVHSFVTKKMLSDDIATLVKTLAGIGEYWQVAKRYSDLLLFVIEEGWLNKMRGQSSVKSEKSQKAEGEEEEEDEKEKARMESAKILSDMRRNASDLDFLLSSRTKNSSSKKNSANILFYYGGVNSETPARMPSPPPAPTSETETTSELPDLGLEDVFATSLDSFSEFSPTHQLDMANIFEWFNWPKSSDAVLAEGNADGNSEGQNGDLGALVAAAGLGGEFAWSR